MTPALTVPTWATSNMLTSKVTKLVTQLEEAEPGSAAEEALLEELSVTMIIRRTSQTSLLRLKDQNLLC